jgi:large subunit ribosomal protein L16
MLRPKKDKFAKRFKGRIRGQAKNGYNIVFGCYALKALEPERIKDCQIESARKAINRYLKRSGKLWIRVFPDYPITKKPADVRMGKGKGSVEYYVTRVKPGKIIFELDSISREQAIGAFARASAKLPLKTKFIESMGGGNYNV